MVNFINALLMIVINTSLIKEISLLIEGFIQIFFPICVPIVLRNLSIRAIKRIMKEDILKIGTYIIKVIILL
jgi:hypothetical protein